MTFSRHHATTYSAKRYMLILRHYACLRCHYAQLKRFSAFARCHSAYALRCHIHAIAVRRYASAQRAPLTPRLPQDIVTRYAAAARRCHAPWLRVICYYDIAAARYAAGYDAATGAAMRLLHFAPRYYAAASAAICAYDAAR